MYISLQLHGLLDGVLRLCVEYLVDAARTRPFRPFEAELVLERRMAGGDVHFVGGGEVTFRWIDTPGELVKGMKAGPFVAAIARHRQQPVPVRTNGCAASYKPGDVAVGVGINVVQRWRHPAAQRLRVFLWRFRAQARDAAEIGGGAGFGPDRAHGESTTLGGIFINHRAVARELQHHLLVWHTLDRDFLPDDLHALPAAAVTVLVRIIGLRFVNGDVFLVHREDGHAERGLAVVADGEAGLNRLGRADGVDARSGAPSCARTAARASDADRLPGPAARSRSGCWRLSSCSILRHRHRRGHRPWSISRRRRAWPPCARG